MKSKDVCVGDVVTLNGTLNNVRLYDINLAQHMYSPDLGKIIPTTDEYNRPEYAKNVRLFEYNGVQQNEEISKLKVWYLHRQYLKELVETSKYYIADVAVPTKMNEDGNVEDYYIEDSDVLVRKTANQFYYFRKKEFLSQVPGESEFSSRFVKNVRPFNYDNIQNYEKEAESLIIRKYRQSKNK